MSRTTFELSITRAQDSAHLTVGYTSWLAKREPLLREASPAIRFRKLPEHRWLPMKFRALSPFGLFSSELISLRWRTRARFRRSGSIWLPRTPASACGVMIDRDHRQQPGEPHHLSYVTFTEPPSPLRITSP
ncbi:hypothetical protein OPV22_031707 [Ensete ventricosum]|uniref:Uncharacterized protein n=1 Tax=Ensete ventricosum TaxID=4639 RepID=A0AAV8P1H3_ENSVE|nr:hypothetical protein OPV22_031707 [Ensete ventricosum]